MPARTAHAVCGTAESPAESGARKRVKFGLFCEDGVDGSEMFACGRV